MGVDATQYVVLGVVLTDKEKVEEYFELTEDKFKEMDKYHDNPYSKDISSNSSGIHIIDDGMSCKYVVVGKILQKNVGDYLSLTTVYKIKKQYRKIYQEILKIDETLNTNFGSLKPRVIAFTHCH